MDASSGRDTVVIAASAGGVEALRELIHNLPPDLPAALLVVLHVPPTGGTVLPKILGRAGRLAVTTASDGERVSQTHVYVGPADRHMLLVDGGIRLSKGPRHNGLRPAADPLFMSAALTAANRTVAVVLSGTLDDGAVGCAAVERRGGLVLVQDPEESAYDSMPRAAIAASVCPEVLRVRDIADRIVRESHTAPPGGAASPDPELQHQLATLLDPLAQPPQASLPWSGVTCPECGSPLRQEDGSMPVRFECEAGHAWSPESLVIAQAAGIERALWAATLRLEERARLNHMLADHADARGHFVSASRFRATALTSQSAARRIRDLLASAGMTQPADGAI